MMIQIQRIQSLLIVLAVIVSGKASLGYVCADFLTPVEAVGLSKVLSMEVLLFNLSERQKIEISQSKQYLERESYSEFEAVYSQIISNWFLRMKETEAEIRLAIEKPNFSFAALPVRKRFIEELLAGRAIYRILNDHFVATLPHGLRPGLLFRVGSPRLLEKLYSLRELEIQEMSHPWESIGNFPSVFIIPFGVDPAKRPKYEFKRPPDPGNKDGIII